MMRHDKPAQRSWRSKKCRLGRGKLGATVNWNADLKPKGVRIPSLKSQLPSVVPVEGLEPPRPFEQQILSLSRLPFRHTGPEDVERPVDMRHPRLSCKR